MKKSITCLLTAVFVAGVAVAEGGPWWKFGLGKRPAQEMSQPECPQGEGRHPDMREMRGRKRPMMSEEQRTKIKAHYEKVHRLAEAARAETDPVKKEELVGQLRVTLMEGAQQMQAEFSKRLEKAEKDVARMRERLEDGEKNMAARVEEHLQQILSGERPERQRHGPGSGGRHERHPEPKPSE
ncbi:hypothetical protein [Tichowtungia aerotolerans]|uniref:Uncharacterized protein n=1 Tax=Tichowtungia aerotolerans TaxID=2697043 RepID=A0A6P1M7R3_9BACT|nr:hypothetical protein [Tichowtungia aerotolerans]QHI70630.1 hypothetical protein GT409_14670 [Tichowtungia aerotolerans]